MNSSQSSKDQDRSRRDILRAIKLGAALAVSSERHEAQCQRLIWREFNQRQAQGHLYISLVQKPYEQGGPARSYAILYHLDPDEPLPLFQPGPTLPPIAQRQRLDLKSALQQVMWTIEVGAELVN
jgi:hypothetical protein